MSAPARIPAAAEFFTVDQVAERMQVSKMTVYRWIEAGRSSLPEIRDNGLHPVFKSGSTIRIPAQALADFFNRHCQGVSIDR